MRVTLSSNGKLSFLHSILSFLGVKDIVTVTFSSKGKLSFLHFIFQFKLCKYHLSSKGK